MASLDFYIEKYGKREGRRRYNRYHVLYRKKNRVKMREYWKLANGRRKANKDGSSVGL